MANHHFPWLGASEAPYFLIKSWPCSPGVAWAQRRPQKAWLVCWCRISRGHGDHVLMADGGRTAGPQDAERKPWFSPWDLLVAVPHHHFRDISFLWIPDRCIVLNQPAQRRATVNHRQSCWNRHFVVKHTLDWASKNWKSAIMCKCV